MINRSTTRPGQTVSNLTLILLVTSLLIIPSVQSFTFTNLFQLKRQQDDNLPLIPPSIPSSSSSGSGFNGVETIQAGEYLCKVIGSCEPCSLDNLNHPSCRLYGNRRPLLCQSPHHSLPLSSSSSSSSDSLKNIVIPGSLPPPRHPKPPPLKNPIPPNPDSNSGSIPGAGSIPGVAAAGGGGGGVEKIDLALPGGAGESKPKPIEGGSNGAMIGNSARPKVNPVLDLPPPAAVAGMIDKILAGGGGGNVKVDKLLHPPPGSLPVEKILNAGSGGVKEGGKVIANGLIGVGKLPLPGSSNSGKTGGGEGTGEGGIGTDGIGGTGGEGPNEVAFKERLRLEELKKLKEEQDEIEDSIVPVPVLKKPSSPPPAPPSVPLPPGVAVPVVVEVPPSPPPPPIILDEDESLGSWTDKKRNLVEKREQQDELIPAMDFGGLGGLGGGGGSGGGMEVHTWESCPRVVRKEKADFHEFVLTNTLFAIGALCLLSFRHRELAKRQYTKLAARIGVLPV